MTEPEPKLPDGITIGKEDDWFSIYRKNTEREEGIMLRKQFTPSDLRAIADHMEWKSRREKPAEVTITDDMVHAAWEKMIPHNPVQPSKAQVREAIQAALATASKTPKGSNAD